MRTILTSIALLTLASAAHADMKVSFDWGPTKKCLDSKSPPMKLSGVPEGTVKLDIRMRDQNVPGFMHGGGKVAYEGQKSLPYGAFRYKGPCPPSGKHKYRFTVKALDGKGKVIGTAQADKMFP
ncbi:phospholipid-binding protein [Rhizobium sp. KVB221]|uniref:Phospholipid-binding protein n=1 Tax=Rhizobium setariae TaxID=2801340 RepID=A0A937CR79_9HYPH|nr:phospholipid-binding protein [Rhizobium setariae]MBL0375519.1 phospholipid-binding protein [Rhizobium setariae]